MHAVALRVLVSGGRAYARAVWWGGVPACYALAPVRVARHGATIAVDLREGSIVPSGTACIELAMRKTVRVSLGVARARQLPGGGRRPHRSPAGVSGAQVASASCALRTAPLTAIASRLPR